MFDSLKVTRMFKIDQLKTSFNCDDCNQLLIDPIALVCGDSVCERHLDELVENASSENKAFVCPLCQDEHSVSKKGFVVNKCMQRGLDSQFNTLKLNPVFDEFKEEIAAAKEKVVRLKQWKRIPRTSFMRTSKI